jgi:hypothetical protein
VAAPLGVVDVPVVLGAGAPPLGVVDVPVSVGVV